MTNTNITLLKPLKKTYGIELKPLSIIYWSRVCFGILAAMICAIGASASLFDSFLTGLSLAMIVYLLTYYVFKWRFITKVEKLSKVFTTGIGAYFLTWAVAWTLFYTLLNTPG